MKELRDTQTYKEKLTASETSSFNMNNNARRDVFYYRHGYSILYESTDLQHDFTTKLG